MRAALPEDEDLEALEPEPGDVKETITLYPLPPIFISAESDNSPTVTKIDVVYVFAKTPSKKLSYIDWRPIAELSDLDQLLEQFGAGTFMLQGRAADRVTMVRQVYHSVGSEGAPAIPSRGALERPSTRAPLDLGQLAAVATPLIAFVTELLDRRDKARREERELERARMSEERQRNEARDQAFMQAMTQLMNARNADLEHMVRAAQRPTANTPAEAYQDGQAATLELIRAVKEEGLGGEDLESRVIDLIQSFTAGSNKADSDVAGGASPNGATS